MITLFEKFQSKVNKPDVNSLTPEFWKMVRLANWKGAIELYKSDGSISSYNQEKRDNYWEQMQFKIYSKYEYKEIQEFNNEYHIFYIQLYDYFYNIWIDPKNHKWMPSDDGYSDLLSSIVGMGKTFTKICIDNTDKFVEVAKNDYYIENFGYLLHINENEYWEIIKKFDPNNIRFVAKKYNL